MWIFGLCLSYQHTHTDTHDHNSLVWTAGSLPVQTGLSAQCMPSTNTCCQPSTTIPTGCPSRKTKWHIDCRNLSWRRLLKYVITCLYLVSVPQILMCVMCRAVSHSELRSWTLSHCMIISVKSLVELCCQNKYSSHGLHNRISAVFQSPIITTLFGECSKEKSLPDESLFPDHHNLRLFSLMSSSTCLSSAF